MDYCKSNEGEIELGILNRKYCFHTEETKEALFEAVDDSIRRGVYHGKCNSDGFKVVTNIRYRFSTILVIRGDFESTKHGTNVKVRIRPFWIMFLFVIFALLIIGIVIIISVINSFNSVNSEVFSWLLGSLLIGYAIIFVRFSVEVPICKRQLINELLGPIEDE
ncbi:MAG: hypothetical protein KAQ68_11240 [Clostridiales bacterium]|nr:hypothetical protein [Clostridiales bacterium]